MDVIEIYRWGAAVSDNGDPFEVSDIAGFNMPEVAEKALDDLMRPYGQFSHYLSRIDLGGRNGPWAFVCLDKQYEIAGHLSDRRTSTGEHQGDIGFLPYEKLPDPIPSDYYPEIGILIFSNKTAAENASSVSYVYEQAWKGLRDFPEDRHWLVFADPLRPIWVTKTSKGDRELWKECRERQNNQGGTAEKTRR